MPTSTRQQRSSTTGTANPRQVRNLLEVARFRAHARGAGLREVTMQGRYIRFGPLSLQDWQRVRLDRLYPGAVVKEAVGTVYATPDNGAGGWNVGPRPRAARMGPQGRRRRAAGGTRVGGVIVAARMRQPHVPLRSHRHSAAYRADSQGGFKAPV